MFASFVAQEQRTIFLSASFATIFPRHSSRNSPPTQIKKACRTQFTTRLLDPSNLTLRQVPVQRLGDLVLRHRSHDLFHNLPVLEQQQCRDSLHAIPAR